MALPSHLLPRPPMPLDASTVAAFERLYVDQIHGGQGAAIEYRLAAPKWQFLCWLADQKSLVLHGSGDPDIVEFEPRQSNDAEAFGNRKAIYGARDGLWPMYFAIVDRARYRMGLMNSCVRVVEPPTLAGSYYFFSIGGLAETPLPARPWRAGTIYLLPNATFERQTLAAQAGVTIESTQVASLVPVRPLARLAVAPDDFPFLDAVSRHDPHTIRARAQANPGGFPWLDVADESAS
ncbi:MAG: hypothetical protein AB7P40_20075 [Chloroflexota bacterium]